MNSKRLIAIAALLIALPVAANAQTSRVEGMALQGDYIKDYTGIYTYPSQVSNVGNLIYGEFGNDAVGISLIDDRAVGAVLGNLWDGRFGTWAIHIREWTPSIGQGDVSSHPGIGGGGSDPNLNNNESFDIMWGKRFGGTSLGLRLNRSMWKSEISTPTTVTTFTNNLTFVGDNFNRNVMGFGGGIGFEINPSTTFEAGFLYQQRTFENTVEPVSAGPGNIEDDGGASYLLAARAMYQWQSNVMLVPVLKYYSFDNSVKATTPGGAVTSTEATIKGWQLGLAGNWTLGSNDLFVLGLTFAQNKAEQDGLVFDSGINPGATYESEITETYMPQVFAALETHVNSWLTLRFGANKGVFSKLKSEGADATEDKVEITFSDFNMMLGAGVKVGTLQFDAILADDFFQNLGYLGSGQSSNTTFSGGYFPKVTATYSF